MPRIATDKLSAGMVLAADVKDLSGRMLLTSGVVLQPKHLRVLKTWGVLGVDVEGDDGADDLLTQRELSDLPPEVTRAIEEEIDKRFRGVDVSHPAMRTLFELVKQELVASHASGEKGEAGP